MKGTKGKAMMKMAGGKKTKGKAMMKMKAGKKTMKGPEMYQDLVKRKFGGRV
jgi:hypothetical protein|tara:strand:+ start:317 stop:472 length:156 start_codon:yes stop_codon:yes gene_type:complete